MSQNIETTHQRRRSGENLTCELDNVRFTVLGLLFVYMLITAVTIYGKINIIGPSSSILLGMQHHAHQTRAIRKRHNQLRMLEIAGWDWEERDD